MLPALVTVPCLFLHWPPVVHHVMFTRPSRFGNVIGPTIRLANLWRDLSLRKRRAVDCVDCVLFFFFFFFLVFVFFAILVFFVIFTLSLLLLRVVSFLFLFLCRLSILCGMFSSSVSSVVLVVLVVTLLVVSISVSFSGSCSRSISGSCSRSCSGSFSFSGSIVVLFGCLPLVVMVLLLAVTRSPLRLLFLISFLFFMEGLFFSFSISINFRFSRDFSMESSVESTTGVDFFGTTYVVFFFFTGIFASANHWACSSCACFSIVLACLLMPCMPVYRLSQMGHSIGLFVALLPTVITL